MVGETLANGLLGHGYTVKRASRDPKKLEDWLTKAGDGASIGTFAEAAAWGDMVVLAVKGTAAEDALKLCGIGNVAGKVVIDTTNPIANEPPQDGVLRFFTGPNDSLHERLQALASDAKLVKAFSCVGYARMVAPDFGAEKPTMFICGNDEGARKRVTELLTQFGWETADMGVAQAARAIEPLCMLWCIPGFLENSWSHAFKLIH
jgi:predicted dinucleotide-binding enzyme